MRLDFNNILANQIGREHGLSRSELNGFINQYSHIIKETDQERQNGKLPFLDLGYEDISCIEKIAKKQSRYFQDFVVLGIGGSALGTRTLHNALNPPFYNLLSSQQRKNHPRLFVLDNVDPEETAALFKLINPKKTLFNVISKSGETVETLAAFLSAIKILKKALGKDYKKNLIITTDPEKGFLRKFALTEGVVSFEVPDGVEGRDSVLSPVALLPAAFTGINIKGLLQGARAMDKRCTESTPQNNPAYMVALINFLLDTRKNKNIVVLMPYTNALKELCEWFKQLWAESLGKRYSLDGKEIFTGPTPLSSIGATDQHSLIQLYNEGPNNKLIIFIEIEKFLDSVKIPKLFKNEPNVDFLQGKSFNELMKAEKKGTEISLTQNHRPNYTIRLPYISEETMGGLIYFWELTTVYAGNLYNVDVFNQPGVEAGKKAAALLLGKR